MYNSDNYDRKDDWKDDCKEDRKDECKYDRKDDECCVSVNIFCDKCKKEKSKEDDFEGDSKTERKCKDEDCCVSVNIFCNKCKKDHQWRS